MSNFTFLRYRAKPQLFPKFALSLYLTVQHKNIDEKKYLLIVLILCGAAQQKLSFILTGGCIGLWASFKHIPSNPRALVSASFIVLIFFIPRALWNLQQVSDPTWLTWLTPLPEKFTDGLRSYREQNWVSIKFVNTKFGRICFSDHRNSVNTSLFLLF